MSKKIFPGPKLRRFREQRSLTQAELARALEISPSYLNQIENNQRPLTAAVLLKLSATFDVDLQTFSDAEDDRLAAELSDALSDPLFQGSAPDLRELKDVVGVSPALAGRFLTLYRAYRDANEQYRRLGEQVSDSRVVSALKSAQFPYEEVRDFFYLRNNYVDPLDRAAEVLQAEQGFRIGGMGDDLARYLSTRHGVSVVLASSDDADAFLRRFDARNRILHLSERSPPSRRAFQMAYQLCLLEHQDLMDRIVSESGFASPEAAAVCRVGLANYFAGALVMPFGSFLSEARRQRYDLERLELHFGVTFESVCHRLSTLQRPGAAGIPFYFLRVDMAGNISKRQSASGFHFARSGGACPLWNVHEAFSAPGKILTQLAQMPDGKVYFCIARTVNKIGGGYLNPQRRFALGLGCEVSYAPELIYSTGIDLDNPDAMVPIGPSCRVCERENCPQRASPPIGRQLIVDESRRSFAPYQFD